LFSALIGIRQVELRLAAWWSAAAFVLPAAMIDAWFIGWLFVGATIA
jgi:hypothetical protein